MAFDYGETAQDALEALQDAGALIHITWQLPPATDAPDAVAPDPYVVEAFGLVLDYSARQVGTQSDSLIRAGDRQVLLAVIDKNGAPVPDIPYGAILTTSAGRVYKVANCNMLEPAGVPVLADINVRK